MLVNASWILFILSHQGLVSIQLVRGKDNKFLLSYHLMLMNLVLLTNILSLKVSYLLRKTNSQVIFVLDIK